MSPRCLTLFLLASLVALNTACAARAPGSPTAVIATPVSYTPSTGQETFAVAIRLSSPLNNLAPGGNAALSVNLEPVIQTVTQRPDGTISTISQKRWDNSSVAQMRYCIATGAACRLTGEWQPFAPTVQTTIPVDWTGSQPVWVVAEFRDAAGKMVPGINPDSRVGPQASAVTQLTGVVDERTPDNLQPPHIQTLLAPTRLAFPVRGSVKIAGSPCCLGGKAGSVVNVPVSFSATSPVAEITAMRVAFQCPRAGEAISAAWEPFTAQKTFTSTVPLNFVGWDIAVQYRDARSNLSPVYCDDISIEGST